MPGPVLLAVDDDPEALGNVESELTERYARDYTIVSETSAADALATLESLAADGAEVALVLARQWLAGMTGGELLGRVHQLHPHAKRGLLIDWGGWGDKATGDAIFDAMAHGRIDYYVLRPSGSPDEVFHSAVSGFLLEWSQLAAHRSAHDPRGRRVLVRPRLRAARRARALRDPARLLPRGLGQGP